MGNPQHLEWLLEGVEAWNARRKRDGFKADFSDTDIAKALRDAGLTTPEDRVNLRGAKLRGAVLQGANLRGAELLVAVLWEADLQRAVLQGANLRGAVLQGAVLQGANLQGAVLWEAVVTTVVNSAAGTNDDGAPEFTDLSLTKGLTQEQIDTMLGDTGTVLPDNLKHPTHWPDWRQGAPTTAQDPLNDDASSQSETRARPSGPQARVRSVVLSSPETVWLGALALQGQIQAEIRRLQEKNWPDDLAKEEGERQIALLEKVLATLNSITREPDADETQEQTTNRWVALVHDYIDETHQILDTNKRPVLTHTAIAAIALFSGTFGTVVPAALMAQLGGPKVLAIWEKARSAKQPPNQTDQDQDTQDD